MRWFSFIIKEAKQFFLFILVLPIIFIRCGSSVYYVLPLDWRKPGGRDSTILYFSKYLQGRTIFLDPGHGGQDRFGKGPKEDAIEADVNLSVALSLRDYLQKAGAKVLMSRTKDTTIALIDRSTLSNNSGADMFISIHHNAIPDSGDPFTNYSSTFYHAMEGDSSYHPANRDIAKYIQREMSYLLGNSGPLSSFDGTLSDYEIYPGQGFSVLRNTKIPAVLTESAFFSSEYEEQRLRKREFNEIEAWGIFRGLGKYFKSGIPKLELVDSSEVYSPEQAFRIQVFDSMGGKINWISAKVDGREVGYCYEPESKLIVTGLGINLTPGEHTLDIIVRNQNGNHSFPFKQRFTVLSRERL